MDDRGQAVVLGAVLLFGIVTIAFAGYQAYQVPNQNAQTEFQHFEEAKDQMVAVRSAAIDTASVDVSRSVMFDLGTRFQQRYLAVNPPSPTGTLETSDQRYIGDNIPARFLTYDPNYREYQPGELWYEHGIVYLDPPNGEIVVLEGPPTEEVEGDTEIRLIPLQNEFSQTGQQRIDVELHNEAGDKTDNTGLVKIPTRLNESQWDNIVEVPVENVDGAYIGIDSSDISDITPVGIEDPPKNNTTDTDSIGEDSGDNGVEGSELPPNAVAFDDQNGNGVYDNGEKTYKEADLAGSGTFNKKGVDLIIERDISASEKNEKMEIKTNTTTVRNDVTISTMKGNSIILVSEYDVDLSGANLIAQGNNANIDVTAGNNNEGDIIANDAVLRANKDIEASPNKGILYVNANGGDKADGGTYIEDTNGGSAELTLAKGSVNGEPEKGSIDT